MSEVLDASDKELRALQGAWERYSGALEQARAAIEGSDQFQDAPGQRAMGYRILFEAQAMAYNFAIAPSTQIPRIYHATAWQTDVYSLGGNGPDFHYGIVFLDGRERYRLSGNANDSKLLLAQLNSALPGSPSSRLIANYDFSDFGGYGDGALDITISAGPRPDSGDWIELDPTAPYQWLMFRPSLHGWNSTPAMLRIERLACDRIVEEARPHPSLADRIDAAAGFLVYLVMTFSVAYGTNVLRLAGVENRLVTIGGETAGEVGSPSARYINGVFAVAEDMALIVEMPERPNGPYWNVQLFDVWLRSLDFVNRQTSLLGDEIAADTDGVIRIVIAAQDPGVLNWLDTTGLTRGQMLVRIYRSRHFEEPVVREVPLCDLSRHLPATVARISFEERATALRRRREAYRRRHGE